MLCRISLRANPRLHFRFQTANSPHCLCMGMSDRGRMPHFFRLPIKVHLRFHQLRNSSLLQLLGLATLPIHMYARVRYWWWRPQFTDAEDRLPREIANDVQYWFRFLSDDIVAGFSCAQFLATGMGLPLQHCTTVCDLLRRSRYVLHSWHRGSLVHGVSDPHLAHQLRLLERVHCLWSSLDARSC